MKAISSKECNFSIIRKDISRDPFDIVLQDLTDAELDNLFTTNESFKKLMLTKRHMDQCLRIFMRAISHGREEKVRVILNEVRNNGLLDSFLSRKINFTNYSGFTFKNITGFKLAKWNGGTRMHELIRSYMSEEEYVKQVREIKKNRIGCTMSHDHFVLISNIARHILPPNSEISDDGSVTIYEEQYEWCFRIYQFIKQAYFNAGRTGQRDALDGLWKLVGIMQGTFPPPLVELLCNELSFKRGPDFRGIARKRKSSFASSKTYRDHDWYTEFGPEVLKNGFGIINYEHGASGCVAVRGRPLRRMDVWPVVLTSRENLVVLTTLYETIKAENQRLNDEVLDMDEPHAKARRLR